MTPQQKQALSRLLDTHNIASQSLENDLIAFISDLLQAERGSGAFVY